MYTTQTTTPTILLANGFTEDTLILAAYLRGAGFPASLLSIAESTCYSLHGIPVISDSQLTEHPFEASDALIIPGDRACTAKLLANPKVLHALSHALQKETPIMTLTTATESVQRRFPQLATATNHLPQIEQPIEALAEQLIQSYVQRSAPLKQTSLYHTPKTIWQDAVTGIFWRGNDRLQTMTPLENNLLHFMLQHPQQRLTATTLINAAWPIDMLKDGIATECLYTLVKNVRQKIEPTRTPQYLRTWRGSPEGGYQFFPNGSDT